MADIERIGYAAWVACVDANVGYSQGTSRADLNTLSLEEIKDGRPLNTDCSAMACWCWKQGGAAPADFNILNLWTGNQRELARQWGGSVMTYTGPSQLRTGDTLWRDGHTAVVYNGYVCEAYIAETGDIYGDRGDTANETRVTPIADYPLYKMTHVIRFPATGSTNSEEAELMAIKDELLDALRKDMSYQNQKINALAAEIKVCQDRLTRALQALDNVNKGLGYQNGTYLAPTKDAVARIDKKTK